MQVFVKTRTFAYLANLQAYVSQMKFDHNFILDTVVVSPADLF